MKNLIKIILLVAAFLSFSNVQFAQWDVVGNMRYPVSGAEAVVHNSSIYIIGGYSDLLQANVNWIQEYKPWENSWEIVAYMQEGRFAFQTGVYNNELYIYGGINDTSQRSYDLEKWNFTDTTTVVAATHEEFDRIYSTAVVSDSGLIIVGGYAGSRDPSTYLPYITRYNFKADSFTVFDDTSYQIGKLPYQQMGAKIENLFYLFGGAYNVVLQNFDVVNLTDYSFVNVQNRDISPRAAGAAVYIEDQHQIYLIGGYNESSPSTPTVEVIYPVTEQSVYREEAPPLNLSRKNLCAVYFEGNIFVFGGEQGNGKIVNTVEKFSSQVTTATDAYESKVSGFELYQNYPNPFNPDTKITFSIQSPEHISLNIYNVLGELVIRLYEGFSTAGNHSLYWNGKDAHGHDLPTGLYFYRLTMNNNQTTKKMLLLK